MPGGARTVLQSEPGSGYGPCNVPACGQVPEMQERSWIPPPNPELGSERAGVVRVLAAGQQSCRTDGRAFPHTMRRAGRSCALARSFRRPRLPRTSSCARVACVEDEQWGGPGERTGLLRDRTALRQAACRRTAMNRTVLSKPGCTNALACGRHDYCPASELLAPSQRDDRR